jgi:acetate kinase
LKKHAPNDLETKISMASRVILCLNSGSSSLKIALYRIGDSEELLLAQGVAELNDGQITRLSIKNAHEKVDKKGSEVSSSTPLNALSDELKQLRLPHPDAVGHRIVHGGPRHAAPERINDKLFNELRGLIPFAPLHLPDELACIEAVTLNFPQLPQVACFDTAFHRSMPEFAQRFALPRVLLDEGIRRYGFHGISYEYIMRTLGAGPPARLIIAHLGNGASMAAVKDGSPLDTTMGFTPAGGFMMGTRSGDLDPGIILYLLNEKHLKVSELADLVNHQSGLRGVSGISDMKMLLERRDTVPDSALAVQMFCYQLRKQIGAFTAALGGLDLLVFTGGIGEKAAPVRWETCNGLEHLGIKLERERNASNADTISADNGGCLVRVIPTNEDLMIARHTYELVFPAR